MAAAKTLAEERREVLHYAATHARSDMISRALEEERKDPEGNVSGLLAAQLGDSRDSALHVACFAGHVDAVRVLLLRGAPADLRNAAGKTPFEVAIAHAPAAQLAGVRGAFEAELFNRCGNGDADGAAALLAGGLDGQCQQGGYTPVAWAELFDQHETAARLRGIEAGKAFAGTEGLSSRDLESALVPENRQESSKSLPSIAGTDAALPSNLHIVGTPAPSAGSGTVEDPGAAWVVTGSADVEYRETQSASGAPSSEVTTRLPLRRRCTQLPFLWPPVSIASLPERSLCKEEESVEFVALPIQAGKPLPVVLPAAVDPEASAELLETLRLALQEVLSCDDELCLPCLTPQLEGLWVGEDVNMLWAAGAEVFEESSVLDEPSKSSASREGLCWIRFAIEEDIAPVGHLRIAVLPGLADSGEGGHVSIVGCDLTSLRAAGEVLRQLVHHGKLDPIAGTLQLPRVELEDTSPESLLGGHGHAPTIFFDILRLSQPGMVAALKQLKGWRVHRVYMPLPEPEEQGSASLLGARLLARIFEVRRVCLACGLELVPVLTVLAEESLMPVWPAARREGRTPPDTAASRSWRGARRRAEAIAELLAQFQGAHALGLRFCHARRRPQAAVRSSDILARIQEVRRLALAVGLGGPRGANLAVWLPSNDSELLRSICEANRGSRRGISKQGAKLTLMLPAELSGAAGTQDLESNVAFVIQHGVSVQLFSSSLKAVSEDSVAVLPLYVWPESAVRERGSALARLCLAGHRAGAQGTVVEVPIYGVPWCWPEAAPHLSWCGLTAFLAAGIVRDPEEGLAALGGIESGPQTAGGQNVLGGLLALHLLSACRPRSQINLLETGKSEHEHVEFEGQPLPHWIRHSAVLARSIWDVDPARTGLGPVATSELLGSLMTLLEGMLPPLPAGGREKVVADTNVLYQLLTERRQLLRQHTQQQSMSAERLAAEAIATARPALQAALVGVEWLRFACRLLLMLLKYTVYGGHLAATGSVSKVNPADDGAAPPASAEAPEGLAKLREAFEALPPAKGSDVRNGFISQVERTLEMVFHLQLAGNRSPSEGGARDTMENAALEALWQGGLRVGAALDLEPWSGFD